MLCESGQDIQQVTGRLNGAQHKRVKSGNVCMFSGLINVNVRIYVLYTGQTGIAVVVMLAALTVLNTKTP